MSYLGLMVIRPISYQVAMPRSGMDNLPTTILNIIAPEMIQALTPYPMTVCPVKWTINSGGWDSTSRGGADDDSEMEIQARGEVQYLEGPIWGLTPNSYQEGGRSWIHIKCELHKISAWCQTCFNQIWLLSNFFHCYKFHAYCSC